VYRNGVGFRRREEGVLLWGLEFRVQGLGFRV
jgi:hypothetical protein